MNNKENVRQLILSGNDSMVELGLILNYKFKCFPQLASFYKKYKRLRFWANHFAVILSKNRMRRIESVLCYELKSSLPWNWIDFIESRFLCKDFDSWMKQINMYKNLYHYKFNNIQKSNYKTHPYTDIFK